MSGSRLLMTTLLAWLEHYPARRCRGLMSWQKSFRFTAANKTGKGGITNDKVKATFTPRQRSLILFSSGVAYRTAI